MLQKLTKDLQLITIAHIELKNLMENWRYK